MSRGERFPGNPDVSQRDLIEMEPSAEGITLNSSTSLQAKLSGARQDVGNSSAVPTSSVPSLQDKLAHLKIQQSHTNPTSNISPSLQSKLAHLKAESPQMHQVSSSPSVQASRIR